MKKSEEFARVQELFSLNILDTPREERFDRITRLVARIFNSPSVAISLITEDRQWFKSAVGLKKTETTRDESICTNTLNEGYLEVTDALEDGRFRNLVAVSGEGQLLSSREGRLRFYAGAVTHLVVSTVAPCATVFFRIWPQGLPLRISVCILMAFLTNPGR